MKLRKATEKDIPQLIELMTQLSEKYRMTTEEMKGRLKDFQETNDHLIVAEENESILGLIGFVIHASLVKKGKCCEIDAFVVDKNHKGKKIGTQLESYVCNFAKENKIVEICLKCSYPREKTGAFAVYKSLGYGIDSTHALFYKSVNDLSVKEEKNTLSAEKTSATKTSDLTDSSKIENSKITLFSKTSSVTDSAKELQEKLIKSGLHAKLVAYGHSFIETTDSHKFLFMKDLPPKVAYDVEEILKAHCKKDEDKKQLKVSTTNEKAILFVPYPLASDLEKILEDLNLPPVEKVLQMSK